MGQIHNFDEFLFEKSNLPTTYEYTTKKNDQDHDKLARKEDEGHKWEKAKGGDKKSGKASRVQKFFCECGYKKTITNDEGKSIVVKYSK